MSKKPKQTVWKPKEGERVRLTSYSAIVEFVRTNKGGEIAVVVPRTHVFLSDLRPLRRKAR